MRPCNAYYAPYISRLIFKTFSMHSYYVLCAPTASYALSVRPIRFHCALASLNVPVAQIYAMSTMTTIPIGNANPLIDAKVHSPC